MNMAGCISAAAFILIALCPSTVAAAIPAPRTYTNPGSSFYHLAYNTKHRVAFLSVSMRDHPTASKIVSLKVESSGVLRSGPRSLTTTFMPNLFVSAGDSVIACKGSGCSAAAVSNGELLTVEPLGLRYPTTGLEVSLFSERTASLWLAQEEDVALLSTPIPGQTSSGVRELLYDAFNKRFTVSVVSLYELIGDEIMTVLALDTRRLIASRVCSKSVSFSHTLSAAELYCGESATANADIATYTTSYIVGERWLYVVAMMKPSTETNPGVPVRSVPSRARICEFDLDTIKEKLADGWNLCTRLSFVAQYDVGATQSCTRTTAGGAVVEGEMCREAGTSQAHIPTGAEPVLANRWWGLEVEEEVGSMVALHANDKVVVTLMIGASMKQLQLFDKGVSDNFDSWTAPTNLLSMSVIDSSSALLLTSSTVYSRSLYNCGSSDVGVISPTGTATCGTCLGLTDPYCGWCTLEQRCKTHEACGLKEYWIPSQGTDECFSVKLTSHAGSISVEEITPAYKLSLTLNKLPSDLVTADYRCSYFGGSVTMDASRVPNQFPPKLSCSLPPLDRIRAQIQAAGDTIGLSISTQLEVQMSRHTFGSVPLQLFDCSLLTSCKECVKSPQCKWKRDGFTCSATSRPGVSYIDSLDECPRVEGSPLNNTFYIHSGQAAALTLHVSNLPISITELQCEVNGTRIPATLSSSPLPGQGSQGQTQVKCQSRQFSYESLLPHVDLPVRLVISSGAYLDSRTTQRARVYKCSRLANLCTQCLGIEHYDCRWCILSVSSSTVGQCLTHDQCTGAKDEWKTECPNPTIRSVKPSEGPLEGGTKLTIEGVNFGKKYTDVNVTIVLGSDSGVPQALRRIPCAVVREEYQSAKVVVCVTGSAASDRSVQAHIELKAFVAGNVQAANQKETFFFKRVRVASILPQIGPTSGGTAISLAGTNLHTGSGISVSICGKPCKHLNASSTHGSSHQLTCAIPPCTLSLPSGVDVGRRSVPVLVTLDRYSYNGTFDYVQDPQISSLQPQRSIRSGGTYVTIKGHRLDLIPNPIFYLSITTAPSSQPDPSSPARGRRFAKERSRRQTAESGGGVTGGVQITVLTGACFNVSEDKLECISPEIPSRVWPLQTDRENPAVDAGITLGPNTPLVTVTDYGLIIGDTMGIRSLASQKNFSTFTIYKDPTFGNFGEMSKALNQKDIIQIKGSGIESLGEETGSRLLSVDVGSPDIKCVMDYVDDHRIGCIMPPISKPMTLTVTVVYGENLRVLVGTLKYESSPSSTSPSPFPVEILAPILVVSALIILGVVVGVCCLCHRRSKQKDEKVKSLQSKMEKLEMSVANECKEAFAELQINMNQMAGQDSDNGAFGLPFFDYATFCVKVMFPKTELPSEHPVIRGLEIPRGTDTRMIRDGLREFRELVYNQTFLLSLIRIMDTDTKFAMIQKVNVASLLSAVLQEKMIYFTKILKVLLGELIGETVSSRSVPPQLLFRRSDHIVEKMLTNWFTCLLQPFLRECVGEPLFVLYQGIKAQVGKGPVDWITHDAKYSLSEDKLLRTQVDFKELLLQLQTPDQDSYQTPQTIKVLDCDTISQVKEKILDVLYRHVAYSSCSRPRQENLDLEWVRSTGERVKLMDTQTAIKASGEHRELSTLRHYRVPNMTVVALVPRENVPYSVTAEGKPSRQGKSGDNLHSSSFSRNASTGNLLHSERGQGSNGGASAYRPYHLVKPSDTESQEPEIGKIVSEVYLTRLLATKGTLQQFVDDLLEAVFSTAHRGSALPLSIKYMFDFLDDQALLHDVQDPDVIHAWKSNCLPLRFWVNLIKNPDFVFDIHKSPIVDACLSVVAQIFMDGCSLSGQLLGKNSPSSKLLYAREIPKYREWVQRYYRDIQIMPGILEEDMNEFLAEESKDHESHELDTDAALYDLYKVAAQYIPQLLTSFQSDEFARQHHLYARLVGVKLKLSL